MSTLLTIHSSLNGTDSLSSTLAGEYAEAWRKANPGGRVLTRDLAAEPVPHLTAARFAAMTADAGERSVSQQAVVSYADGLVAELRAAREIVLAVPMYNFGIPSTLKAYFDHVARAGVTFRYTAQGPEGLLGGRRVVVFTARGGQYAGSPLDTQSDYLRNFLGFLGMSDVEFVYAEGTAMGEDALQAAVESARRRIRELAALAA